MKCIPYFTVSFRLAHVFLSVNGDTICVELSDIVTFYTWDMKLLFFFSGVTRNTK